MQLCSGVWTRKETKLNFVSNRGEEEQGKKFKLIPFQCSLHNTSSLSCWSHFYNDTNQPANQPTMERYRARTMSVSAAKWIPESVELGGAQRAEAHYLLLLFRLLFSHNWTELVLPGPPPNRRRRRTQTTTTSSTNSTVNLPRVPFERQPHSGGWVLCMVLFVSVAIVGDIEFRL